MAHSLRSINLSPRRRPPAPITIQFTSGSADLPKISAIEISSAAGEYFVQVNPTPVSLYASQQQQFTASVTGNSNTAVNWSYSPQIGTLTAGGLYTAPPSITAAQTVSVTATSQADTTKSASATVNLLPPAGSFSPIFVNSGGGAYTDTLGNSWSADTGFTGGSVSSTTKAIANTPDPALYQTNRHGPFSYQFNTPPGNYNVILKFAETYWTSAGQRLFNVSINGTQVLTNFDIVAAAGAPLTAVDKSFPVTVTGSSITIQFTTGTVDLPLVNAVEIKTASSVGIQINPTTAALLFSQSKQFGATVTGTTNTGCDLDLQPASWNTGHFRNDGGALHCTFNNHYSSDRVCNSHQRCRSHPSFQCFCFAHPSVQPNPYQFRRAGVHGHSRASLAR